MPPKGAARGGACLADQTGLNRSGQVKIRVGSMTGSGQDPGQSDPGLDGVSMTSSNGYRRKRRAGSEWPRVAVMRRRS